LLELSLRSVADPSASVNPIERFVNATCGDADAIAELEFQAGLADSVMSATGALTLVGKRSPIEFLDTLSQFALPDDRKAMLLSALGGWLIKDAVEVARADIKWHTAWAISSKNENLANAANDLRALFGDSTALQHRVDRLMDCANGSDDDIGHDCLGREEFDSGPLAEIQSRWPTATVAERTWLVRWSRHVGENQSFLLAQLPNESSQVQYQILIEALPGPDSNEYAIQGALRVIEQALARAERRPANVPIDFDADYSEGYLGIKAYEQSGGYPAALQAAFDELTTYPDATGVMAGLADLDHPWLSTQAGIWLMRHDDESVGMHALRFALDKEGIPAKGVMDRLIPFAETVPPAIRNLFLRVVDQGGMGKLEVFASHPFDPLLHDPEVNQHILDRIARLPVEVESMGLDITISEGLVPRLMEKPQFREEMRSIRWAVRSSAYDPVLARRYVDALAALDAPIWKGFAMEAASDVGDTERARKLAREQLDSPSQEVRQEARRILDGKPWPEKPGQGTSRPTNDD
jgi:hypothetical protein